jgi:hypothetical protein
MGYRLRKATLGNLLALIADKLTHSNKPDFPGNGNTQYNASG